MMSITAHIIMAYRRRGHHGSICRHDLQHGDKVTLLQLVDTI